MKLTASVKGLKSIFYMPGKPGIATQYGDKWDFYLDCVRKDTQRKDDEIGKSDAGINEDWTPEEADRQHPILSNNLAPSY